MGAAKEKDHDKEMAISLKKKLHTQGCFDLFYVIKRFNECYITF